MKMCFIQLTGSPIRIVGISDSAYKVEDDGTRALVGHMIVHVAGYAAASAVSSKVLTDNSTQSSAKISDPEFHQYLAPPPEQSPFGPCI